MSFHFNLSKNQFPGSCIDHIMLDSSLPIIGNPLGQGGILFLSLGINQQQFPIGLRNDNIVPFMKMPLGLGTR